MKESDGGKNIRAGKSTSEAAKRHYISQPGLTAAIRELEQELGVTIFDRSNKGVSLTPEGEVFFGYAGQGKTVKTNGL